MLGSVVSRPFGGLRLLLGKLAGELPGGFPWLVIQVKLFGFGWKRTITQFWIKAQRISWIRQNGLARWFTDRFPCRRVSSGTRSSLVPILTRRPVSNLRSAR